MHPDQADSSEISYVLSIYFPRKKTTNVALMLATNFPEEKNSNKHTHHISSDRIPIGLKEAIVVQLDSLILTTIKKEL